MIFESDFYFQEYIIENFREIKNLEDNALKKNLCAKMYTYMFQESLDISF